MKFYATGRRKKAVARVWLMPGEGKITINRRDGESYLSRNTNVKIVEQPLVATGTPARATIGNGTFGLESAGNQPGQPALLYMSLLNGTVDLGGGCTQYFGGLVGTGSILMGSTISDGTGLASFPLPVPADPAFEGLTANFQAAGVNPTGGPLLGMFELTNGLRVRVGDAIPSCP